jgi:cytochrome c-type biogenesis protein CcmH/NrfG
MLALNDEVLNRYGPGFWLLVLMIVVLIVRLIYPPARDRWRRRMRAAARCNQRGDVAATRRNVLAAIRIAQGHRMNDEVIQSLVQLGRFYLQRQELAEAEASYREALVLGNAQQRPQSRPALDAWRELAALVEQRGHDTEAESLLQIVVSTAESILGPDTAFAAASLHDLAELIRRQGRPAEADAYQRRSDEMLRRLSEKAPARKA